MQLRPARKHEFDAIYAILEQNALWMKDQGIFQWPMDWLDSIRTELQQSVDNGLFYVVELQQQIAAVVEVLTEPEHIWQYDNTPALYLHKFAIDRQYAGSGLGKSMLNWARTKALSLGMDCLRLDCVSHNPELRQYYESAGFQLKAVVAADIVDRALYELPIRLK